MRKLGLAASEHVESADFNYYINLFCDCWGLVQRVPWATGYGRINLHIVRRDDGCGTTVKRNDDGRWSSDGVVLCLGMRQNRDVIEWWGE
jgi:hypothetical protein